MLYDRPDGQQSEIPHFSLALYRPQIPQNTGNIARTAVATGARLMIIGKPSFSLDESRIRRAGLDYWPHLQLECWPRWSEFRRNRRQRVVAFSKSGKNLYSGVQFAPGDILLLGNETAGLPPRLLRACDEVVSIPMWGPVRSLNLSNAAAIAAYEFLRQCPPADNPGTYERTWYRRLLRIRKPG